MAMDVDGASTTVEEEEDVPTCTLFPFSSEYRLTLFSQTPRSKHLLAPAPSPLLRHHGTRGTYRSRRVFLRYP